MRIGETIARRASTSSITRSEDVIVRLGSAKQRFRYLQSIALFGGVERGGEMQDGGAERLLGISARSTARSRKPIKDPVLMALGPAR